MLNPDKKKISGVPCSLAVKDPVFALQQLWLTAVAPVRSLTRNLCMLQVWPKGGKKKKVRTVPLIEKIKTLKRIIMIKWTFLLVGFLTSETKLTSENSFIIIYK